MLLTVKETAFNQIFFSLFMSNVKANSRSHKHKAPDATLWPILLPQYAE